MKPLRQALAIAAVAAAFGACSPRDGSAEVAGELRALRLALRGNGAVDPDRAALQAAVAAVAQSQQQFAERQAALQADLARWSQLVARDADSSRHAEAKAMAVRLAELDAELQQQKARHAELEAVLRQTIDRAADRIDALLQRQGGGAPASVGAGDGGAGPAGERPPAPTPVGGLGFDPRLAWAALAACSVVVASFLLRGRSLAGGVTAAVADADEGVPVGVIAPFTALAGDGAAAAGPGFATSVVPAGERLAVPAARAAAILAALASEPLVLRRPAPHVVSGDAGAEIRYWLAPACGAAAHHRLRQRALAAR